MTDRELMQKVLSFLETNYLVMCSQFHMQKDALAGDLRKRLAQPDEWKSLTDKELEVIQHHTTYGGKLDPKRMAILIEEGLKERNYVETNT